MLVRIAFLFGVSLIAVVVHGESSYGQTLRDALITAYDSNPSLNAQRARLRATDEQVPQALSGWRPTIRTFAEVGPNYLDANRESLVGKEDNDLFTRTFGATLEQPLYRGGQTAAAVRAAENSVLAEKARLISAEQEVLLRAVTAYSDVFRDQAVLDLTIRDEQRLARQLEATRDRFQVGEVTRTDVSQAEARLARSTAQRIGAEGNLAASRAAYRNVVGVAPALLTRPEGPDSLPADLVQANALAVDWNPAVTSAEYEERRSLDSIDQVRGELLPELTLIGQLERDIEGSRNGARIDQAQALIRLDVPLYQSGATYSRLREAKQTATEQRRRLDQSQRDAVEDATRAWNALETAIAEIGSRAKQVEANQIALEGVEREAEVGARTVLDVLDAQQELLESQVSLVRAERDQVVAAFELKASVGQLTARALNLPVTHYDPHKHYREVRDSWFGGSSSGDVSSDFDHNPRRE